MTFMEMIKNVFVFFNKKQRRATFACWTTNSCLFFLVDFLTMGQNYQLHVVPWPFFLRHHFSTNQLTVKLSHSCRDTSLHRNTLTFSKTYKIHFPLVKTYGHKKCFKHCYQVQFLLIRRRNWFVSLIKTRVHIYTLRKRKVIFVKAYWLRLAGKGSNKNLQFSQTFRNSSFTSLPSFF